MKRILSIFSLLLILLCFACEKDDFSEEGLIGRWHKHMTHVRTTQNGLVLSDTIEKDQNQLWLFKDEHGGQIGKGEESVMSFSWFYDADDQMIGIMATEWYSLEPTMYHVRWNSNDRVVLSRTYDNWDTTSVILREEYLKR